MFVAPSDGTYKLELWGAQGGRANVNQIGGKGDILREVLLYLKVIGYILMLVVKVLILLVVLYQGGIMVVEMVTLIVKLEVVVVVQMVLVVMIFIIL